MQVIICGAGMVGTTLAKYLVSENNNVTLIEKNKDILDKVTNNLEIKPICGYASHPSVLEEAGAANADMIIAVTRNDEVNMVACQVAHSLFNVPTKIARVRFLDYINPEWSELYAEKNMPIDAIISPEEEMAKAVIRRLEIPDAIEVINLADDKIKFIGVRCSADIAAINLHIAEFPKVFPELNLNIVCLVRNNKSIALRPNEKIIEGDEVYFTVDAAQISRAMRVFGEQKDKAHKILIFGGGNVGFKIASTLEKEKNEISCKVIEKDYDIAADIAQNLKEFEVICGDVVDGEILINADIDNTHTVIAVTNDDEANVLSSLFAKKKGVKRTIALIKNQTFQPLIKNLGIDAVIDPRVIMISTILQRLRKGKFVFAQKISDEIGDIVEGEIKPGSELIGEKISCLNLPKGSILAGLLRNEQVLNIRADFNIEVKDRIIIYCRPNVINQVENIFSVELDYL